ncbi:hypothetical protein R3P38DRAFT_3343849 [Favolaschia claudopus]|uniref:Uncharacterized protein n=1 Tax=Favolaschia claudopus TaxID=2862362 RepID=A0AAW0DK07_9AGAR
MFGISCFGLDIDDPINAVFFRSPHLISLKAFCPRPVRLRQASTYRLLTQLGAGVGVGVVLLALRIILKSVKLRVYYGLRMPRNSGLRVQDGPDALGSDRNYQVPAWMTFEYTDRRPASKTTGEFYLPRPPSKSSALVAAAAPRSGAHSFEYMDRVPASNYIFAENIAAGRQIPPTTREAAGHAEASTCCLTSYGTVQWRYTFSTPYRRPASGRFDFEIYVKFFLTSVSLSESFPCRERRLLYTSTSRGQAVLDITPVAQPPHQNSIVCRPASDISFKNFPLFGPSQQLNLRIKIRFLSVRRATLWVPSQKFLFPLRGALDHQHRRCGSGNLTYRVPVSEGLNSLVFRAQENFLPAARATSTSPTPTPVSGIRDFAFPRPSSQVHWYSRSRKSKNFFFAARLVWRFLLTLRASSTLSSFKSMYALNSSSCLWRRFGKDSIRDFPDFNFSASVLRSVDLPDPRLPISVDPEA